MGKCVGGVGKGEERCGGMGKSGKRCGEVCWSVGKVREDVGENMGMFENVGRGV